MEGVPQIQVDQLHHIVSKLYSLEHWDEPAEEENLPTEAIVNVLKNGVNGTGKGSQFTRR